MFLAKFYRKWLIPVLVLALTIGSTSSADVTSVNSVPWCNVTFDPVEVKELVQDTETTLMLNVTCDWSFYTPVAMTAVTMEIWSSDPEFLKFSGIETYNSTSDADYYDVTEGDDPYSDVLIIPLTSYDDVFYANVTLRGVGFGRWRVIVDVCVVEVSDDGGFTGYHVCRPSAAVKVAVVSPGSVLTIIFAAVLGASILVYNLGFGCTLEPKHILEIVKRPIGPVIGMVCQFVFMAPLSFGIAKMLQMNNLSGLGLLAVGAAPGGGGSNVFTKLLDGDLELSITMSFISTLVSLGMTPLWLFALGRYFQEEGTKTVIPIENVFTSLAVVTVPVVIGILVRKFFPKAAKKIAFGLKPLTGIMGVFFVGMGVYLNLPAMLRADWRVIVATLLVPIIGYSLGAGAAAIFKQGREKIITISLETGFQNFSLAIMLLGSSLESPDSEMASVVPTLYTFLSAAFPALAFIGIKLRHFFIWAHKRLSKQDVKPHVTADVTDNINHDDSKDNDLIRGADGIKPVVYEEKHLTKTENGTKVNVNGNNNSRGDCSVSVVTDATDVPMETSGIDDLICYPNEKGELVHINIRL